MTDTDFNVLLLTGRALVKFRLEHGYPAAGLADVIACNDAIEARDVRKALKHFRSIAFGGMGTFNDWLPSVAYEHEDADYCWAIGVALFDRWYRLMKAAAGEAV
ncbi:MAG: hypothetical protein WBD40_07235 [Tepidisphaeraceae bacterium]